MARKVSGLSMIGPQAPVVRTMDSAIRRRNDYPVVKSSRNQLHYPMDNDLSGGLRYPPFEQLGPGSR